jgi:hypothetical protein
VGACRVYDHDEKCEPVVGIYQFTPTEVQSDCPAALVPTTHLQVEPSTANFYGCISQAANGAVASCHANGQLSCNYGSTNVIYDVSYTQEEDVYYGWDETHYVNYMYNGSMITCQTFEHWYAVRQ